jgi:hypothetical protein
MTQHEISAFESKQESLSVAYCEKTERHTNSSVTGSMDIHLCDSNPVKRKIRQPKASLYLDPDPFPKF